MPRTEPGYEPDYRFSLANERTLLAWIQTAFGLLALGLPLAGGIHGVRLPLWHHEIGMGAIALSVMIVPAAYRNWRRSQLAMRLGVRLPRDPLPVIVAAGVATLLMVTLVSAVMT
jgi:putative membrane protein